MGIVCDWPARMISAAIPVDIARASPWCRACAGDIPCAALRRVICEARLHRVGSTASMIRFSCFERWFGGRRDACVRSTVAARCP